MHDTLNPRRVRRPVALAAAALLSAAAAVAAGSPAGASVAAHHGHPRLGHSRFQQVNLVSDQPGHAQVTDAHLVNAWGLAAGPTTPIWVSDNGADVSTLYSGGQAGTPVTVNPLVVAIPGGGAPTGVVFNTTTGFALSSGGRTGPARFLFAGEDGDLSAWNLTGDTSKATLVAHTRGAVYKGLALIADARHPLLLAANFHDNRIDLFDGSFRRVHRPFAFASFGIPRGFAPFDVAVLGGRVYVTYAKQDAARHDDVAGPGNGFINVYDLRGHFIGPFARRGVLNSPWGMTLAPAGFGDLAGRLLVGNFGDGRVHAFNPRAGFLPSVTLRGAHGAPLQIDGLWGLLPGNGTAAGTSDVWFSAGPDGESHGLLGVLRAAH